MPDRTYKMIQIVGASNKSFADAVSRAIKRASKTIHGLAWFEVKELRGAIEAGKVSEYQVKVDVAFKLD